MNIKQKIQSMSAHDIIMAMVEGLENPVTEINMATYGDIVDDICYGCAATNAICKIGNFEAKPFIIARKYAVRKPTESFISIFEHAIDKLRRGDIGDYNMLAKEGGFATIDRRVNNLPLLDNYYTKKDLEKYKLLAKKQLICKLEKC